MILGGNKKDLFLETNVSRIRKGCVDNFHAFLVKDASYDGYYDIPLTPQIGYKVPTKLIAYDRTANHKYEENEFVHFYLDDQKFDGPNGIWHGLSKREMKRGFNIARFSNATGIIAPDFSLYLDMPRCMQIWNVYRSRAIGYYLFKLGYYVIPNVRWTDESSYSFAFDGLNQGMVLAVGTLGCSKEKLDRHLFIKGFIEMNNRLKPSLVIIYGCIFKELKEIIERLNITVKQFPSDTSLAFSR